MHLEHPAVLSLLTRVNVTNTQNVLLAEIVTNSLHSFHFHQLQLISSFLFWFKWVLTRTKFSEFVWDLTCTVTLWSLIILKTLSFSAHAVTSLTWGRFHSIIKLIMAGNCPSLPQHLSASHLLNRVKINQWLLVFASPLLLLLLQLERKWWVVAAVAAGWGVD